MDDHRPAVALENLKGGDRTLRPGDFVKIAVPTEGVIGPDGRVHLHGTDITIDPAHVPISKLYADDHPINDPMFSVRRDPDDNPKDPHASRAYLWPGGSWGSGWMGLQNNTDMDHDQVVGWIPEKLVEVVGLIRKHVFDDPGCTVCRPWVAPRTGEHE